MLCSHPTALRVWRCPGASPTAAGGAICQSLSVTDNSPPSPTPGHIQPEAHLSGVFGLLQSLTGRWAVASRDSCLVIRNLLPVHPHANPGAAAPAMYTCLQICSRLADSKEIVLAHHSIENHQPLGSGVPIKPTLLPATAFPGTSVFISHSSPGHWLYLVQQSVRRCQRGWANRWGLS